MGRCYKARCFFGCYMVCSAAFGSFVGCRMAQWVFLDVVRHRGFFLDVDDAIHAFQKT